MSPLLFSRQNQDMGDGNETGDFDVDEDYDRNNWWFSQTAQIVKWSILAAILVFFMVWFVGGHYHAKRRVRKGLTPLFYHRFLVPYHQRGPGHSKPQNQFSFYRQHEGYAMDSMPPPGYNPNSVLPPSYQPPAGASKANPNQFYDVPPPGSPPNQTQEYDIPPPGAPPGQLPSREPKKKQSWANKATNINPFKRN